MADVPEGWEERVSRSTVEIKSHSFQTPESSHLSSIHIKDKAHVEETVKGLIDGGTEKLQLIVDFDYTLTRWHKNGEPVDCSWGVMENSHLLPDDYVAKTRENKDKYMKIEHDPTMTMEEKIPFMIEWYTKANQLLQECGVSRGAFHEMVKHSNIEFRDGANHMLDILAQVNVPVLILSAGLGDLIVEVLQARGVHHDNLKVVSNFMKYENGVVAGLDGDMIHMFNKNENSVHGSSYFKDLQHRPNVILMGDSLGDLRMAEGVENLQHILRIGFLNPEVCDEKLKKYMASFDVVLADDQTMDFPNAIIERILKKEQEPVEL